MPPQHLMSYMDGLVTKNGLHTTENVPFIIVLSISIGFHTSFFQGCYLLLPTHPLDGQMLPRNIPFHNDYRLDRHSIDSTLYHRILLKDKTLLIVLGQFISKLVHLQEFELISLTGPSLARVPGILNFNMLTRTLTDAEKDLKNVGSAC